MSIRRGRNSIFRNRGSRSQGRSDAHVDRHVTTLRPSTRETSDTVTPERSSGRTKKSLKPVRRSNVWMWDVLSLLSDLAPVSTVIVDETGQTVVANDHVQSV